MDNHFLCALLSYIELKISRFILCTLLAYYAIYQSVHVYFNCTCTKYTVCAIIPQPVQLRSISAFCMLAIWFYVVSSFCSFCCVGLLSTVTDHLNRQQLSSLSNIRYIYKGMMNILFIINILIYNMVTVRGGPLSPKLALYLIFSHPQSCTFRQYLTGSRPSFNTFWRHRA